MNINNSLTHQLCTGISCSIFALLLTGCASTSNSTSSANSATAPGHIPSKYRALDGRNIDIGSAHSESGGMSFKEPHMEKCWIADGFNFTGYDTLYIAPTLSTAKFQPDEEQPHQIAKQNLPVELGRALAGRGLFANVVYSESDIKTNMRVLKLENTITEYSKGGGGARYWVGLYGGGQPVLRVNGKMNDGDKSTFAFEMRRSGVSGEARFAGGYMKDVDIQLQDIRSVALDLSDFMMAIAGKYQARN
jgi:hypothetical protein